jgi:hypothetical protein
VRELRADEPRALFGWRASVALGLVRNETQAAAWPAVRRDDTAGVVRRRASRRTPGLLDGETEASEQPGDVLRLLHEADELPASATRWAPLHVERFPHAMHLKRWRPDKAPKDCTYE